MADSGLNGGHAVDSTVARGRLVYSLPVGKKGPRYARVEHVKTSSKGKVSFTTKGSNQIFNIEDEGEKWAWAAEARTGLLVAKQRSGDAANFAMLARLSDVLFDNKLPQEAKDCVLKFVQGGIARFDSQGSVFHIVDDWSTVIVDLSCLNRYSAGMMACSSCALGPTGSHLYVVAREVKRPGIPDDVDEPRSHLLSLKLPMHTGDTPQRLCAFTDNDLRNLLHSGVWTSDGVILLGERDDTGNVAQHLSWDGSLTWELEGRSLPKFDWLDNIAPDGLGGFVLMGTSYQSHEDGRRYFLSWDPVTRQAEVCAWGESLLRLSDLRFPQQSQTARGIALLQDSTIIYAACGEDEEDNFATVLWRCRLSSMDVISCVELEDFRLSEMHVLPDHRLLVISEGHIVFLDKWTLNIMHQEDIVEIEGKNEPGNVGHEPDCCPGWVCRGEFIHFCEFSSLG